MNECMSECLFPLSPPPSANKKTKASHGPLNFNFPDTHSEGTDAHEMNKKWWCVCAYTSVQTRRGFAMTRSISVFMLFFSICTVSPCRCISVHVDHRHCLHLLVRASFFTFNPVSSYLELGIHPRCLGPSSWIDTASVGLTWPWWIEWVQFASRITPEQKREDQHSTFSLSVWSLPAAIFSATSHSSNPKTLESLAKYGAIRTPNKRIH